MRASLLAQALEQQELAQQGRVALVAWAREVPQQAPPESEAWP